MEENENENNKYNEYNDFYNQSNANQNNSFENSLNVLSELNQLINDTINNNTSSIPMSSITTILERLDDKKVPYPINGEIPLLKIQDGNHFKNGNDIENYIQSLGKSGDNKFNLCAKFTDGENKFFCENCNQNICDNCSKNCELYNHSLFDLEKFSKEVNQNKMDITFLMSKYFMSHTKKQDTDRIEKKVNYDIKDGLRYEADNEIEGNIKEYTNDIILILYIITKDYNNYFHFYKY